MSPTSPLPSSALPPRRAPGSRALLLALVPAFTGWSSGLCFAQEEPYAPRIEPASDEGARAMARVELPEGFTIDLFAAEPMLANPVCLYVADDGEVFVAESFRVHRGVTDMRSHMDWLEDELANETVEERVAMYARHEGEEGFAAYGTEHERIRLLRDTDGDGRADEAIVFADGFRDPADGIAAGLLVNGEDVYYTCIPHLWRLRDTDGDGVADERSALSSGYGVHVALLGHDLHGLRIGPDGKLYFSCGDRGFSVETEDGLLHHPHTGAVLRCNLDGSDLEIVHTGLRNPQELVFDEWGNLFTGENNSDGGDQARWVQIVEGADSGWRFYYQYVTEPVSRGPWNDEKLWHPHHADQPAYVLPPIANLGNGPAGLTYYPGTGFDDSYRGHFFLCDFRGQAKTSGIHTFTNLPAGAGFELGPVEWFAYGLLPTDADFGPDGALYASDWVHGWDMTGKGRVFTIRSTAEDASQGALRDETRELLAADLTGFESSRLVLLLQHADQRVRQKAQFALVARGAPELENCALDASAPTLRRVHGIWGVGMVARRSPRRAGALPVLLGDGDPEVRAQAARVLGDLRSGDAGPYLVPLLTDASPRVRMYAALGLGRIGVPEATPALFDLVAETGDSDPVLRHAAVMGLRGCASDAELRAAAEHDDRHVRLAALLVMRHRGDARIAGFLRDDDPLLRREAATAIYDVDIGAALGALAALAGAPGVERDATARRALAASRFLGGPIEARRLADVAADPDRVEAHRAEALAFLAEWADPGDIDPVTGRWLPVPAREAASVADLLVDLAPAALAAPDTVARAWVEAIAATGAGAEEHLLGVVEDSARAADLRVAALEALAPTGHPATARAVAAAMEDADGRVRAAGLAIVPQLSPEAAFTVVGRALEAGDWSERAVAYGILGELGTPEADALLVHEMKRARNDLVPAEVTLELVLAAEARAAEAAELRTLLDERLARRGADAELAPWLDTLFGGDAAAGREVFEKDLAVNCMRCHLTWAGGSERVGPSLEDVGRRLTRLQLLESVVAPNRHVAGGYEATTFWLLDGSVAEGRVIGATDAEIRVMDSDGEVFGIPRADIEEQRTGLSAMPAGLGDSLSREAMRDLIEYLSSLR